MLSTNRRIEKFDPRGFFRTERAEKIKAIPFKDLLFPLTRKHRIIRLNLVRLALPLPYL